MPRVRTTQLAPERPTWSQCILHENLPHGTGVWILDGDLTFRQGRVIFETGAFPVAQGDFTIAGALKLLSGTTYGRLTSFGSNYLSLAANLSVVGGQVYLDDTAKHAIQLIIDPDLAFTPYPWSVWRATAGANPRGTTVLVGVDEAGGIHERARTTAMGEWDDVPYDAGNFTANGAMTWTVQVGDQVTYSSARIGKTIIFAFNVQGSSVGGTPDTELRIRTPNGETIARTTAAVVRAVDNGTVITAHVIAASGDAFIKITREDGLAWAASANLTNVNGCIIYTIS